MERGGPSRGRLTSALQAVIPWGLGFIYVASALDVGRPVAAVVGAAIAVALTRRREQPEIATAVVVVADLLFHVLVPGLVIPFAGLVAMWSLTLVHRPRVSLLALAGVLLTAGLNGFRTTADETIFTVALCVSVWALAEAARNRVVAAQEAAKRALGEERARIARELHDVIADSVSVIVVQAAAASDVFDQHPDQARVALRSIEGTGREALGELRLLVGTVRPGDDGAPQAPQPGLDQVDELAGQLGAAGLQVRVHRDGSPRPLPAAVDLSAYRIVQEALTNTLRHARATVAEVTLGYGSDALEVDVTDDGLGPAARPGQGGGFGLVGMHERAAVLGGSFEAGPTAHGGFRVHARLPLGSAP